MNKMIVIIGAGIAGISAAYHLNLKGKKSIIFEKDNSWGGLCNNFEIKGFTFDKAVHLSFTKDKYVKSLFAKSTDFFTYNPDPTNYYKGVWLKHPAQNNIYPLEVEEKIKIIKDFINRKKVNKNTEDYENWLRCQYGNYFAENFPMRYTRKYWTLEAKNLSTSWIKNRMYKPTIGELLKGAMTNNTPNTYYANKMRYPKKGGYKSFLNFMAKKCDIRLNKKATLIDIKKKKVFFEDGSSTSYSHLISSIPLPELVGIIKNVPNEIIKAAQNLSWTSIALVSLGFNRPNIPKNLWFYIYDEDFLPSRAYSPSVKSPYNVPKECSSLQFEIYFSKHKKMNMTKEDLINHVVKKSVEIGLFKKEDIMVQDCKIVDYANIIFDHDFKKNREKIHKYLDSIGISYIGRFGEWDYLWSDQSLLSGKSITKWIQ